MGELVGADEAARSGLLSLEEAALPNPDWTQPLATERSAVIQTFELTLSAWMSGPVGEKTTVSFSSD